ncbi:MAG: RND transporter [Candidatus Latescibacteria bacterium 4484_107]|nr:MAG: RND transporter [Candidatus Latescibacteria bacterium 4484_107]
MKATADLIIKFRWPIIIGFIVVTAILAMQIPKAEIDADMKSQLPEDMVSRINTDKIDELFGGTEMLMVLIRTDDVLQPETLKRVKKISKQMNRLKGVDKVLSLFDLKNIKGEDGAMTVNPVVRRIPRTEAQRAVLRSEIKGNDIVYGSVVSKDFTITAIIAVLKSDVLDAYIIPAIEKLIQENPGKEEILIGGIPYIRGNVSRNIQTDMRRLMPIGLLGMLIFLFACFKQLRGVVLPFLVVIMSILFSLGMIPVLGWKVQVITIILPVFLIAVANDYGIHMIAKYQEDNVSGNRFKKGELAKRMFTSLGKPVLITGLTTMAGMLCLLGHAIIPARQLGILSAIGILFALTASLFFIPAIISLLPKSRPVLSGGHDPRESKHLLERLLWFFGNLVSTRPKTVIAAALIFSALSVIGIFFVVVDTDPKNYFSHDHPVVYATDVIDQNLGGSQNISVVFEGDIKEPRIMHKIDALEQKLRNMPEVGNTVSIARVIRQMSRALNDPNEPGYDRIPDTRNAIAQYFELYAMSGDAEDFEKMVDFPCEHAVITARINTTSTAKLSHVVHRIGAMVKDDPDVLLVGGFGVVLSDLAKLMVHGQFLSLGLATVLVALLLMILFRSVTAGLISAIPLLLSMAILFGLMGLFGIELNIVTAMLSSIMIGVGIDYTIHFLWRYREERQNGLAAVDAVKKTLTTTGRGIIFNAFSVIIGFVALLFSGFLPVQFFGFLVVVSIFACLVGALVLVPSLCIVLKPKFLEPKDVG